MVKLIEIFGSGRFPQVASFSAAREPSPQSPLQAVARPFDCFSYAAKNDSVSALVRGRTTSRAAAVKIQAAIRRRAHSTKWRAMLATFPERTKAALLTRAMEEKERADGLEDVVRKAICSELVERMRTAVSEKLRLDAERKQWEADSAQAAFLAHLPACVQPLGAGCALLVGEPSEHGAEADV